MALAVGKWVSFLYPRTDYSQTVKLALSSRCFQTIAAAVSIATRMLKYSITYLFLLIPSEQ